MLDAAKKSGLIFDAIEVSQGVKRDMPIWYHPSIEKCSEWNSAEAKCHRRRHDVKTMGDMLDYHNTPFAPYADVNAPPAKKERKNIGSDGFRVLGDSSQTSAEKIKRAQLAPDIKKQSRSTNGSCDKNGDEDAKTGSGVWFDNDSDLRNLAFRLPSNLSTNNPGEIIAILLNTDKLAISSP
ncbi:hypothetical protein M422DRAFT_243878 [Sphaerobolus stellatus SS14]|nr:hypothetical protein M422DRAFT_243878 [Sphaerobolus stellatus SS14]